LNCRGPLASGGPGMMRRSSHPIVTPLSPDVFQILGCKRIGSQVWPCRVTWRHWSSCECDHSIRHSSFASSDSFSVRCTV